MDRIRNDKIVLMIISITTLFIAVVAISFAYFTAANGGTSTTELLVQTATMDSLVFSSDEQITFDVYQNDFEYGDADVVGVAYSNVELTASNSNDSKEYCYSINLDILQNNFEYTTEEFIPELVVSLYGSDEPFQEDMSNATLLVDELDLTIKRNTQSLLENGFIKATKGTTAHKYYKTVIKLKNLDTVQDDNAGKEFIGSIIIDKASCLPE